MPAGPSPTGEPTLSNQSRARVMHTHELSAGGIATGYSHANLTDSPSALLLTPQSDAANKQIEAKINPNAGPNTPFSTVATML